MLLTEMVDALVPLLPEPIWMNEVVNVEPPVSASAPAPVVVSLPMSNVELNEPVAPFAVRYSQKSRRWQWSSSRHRSS